MIKQFSAGDITVRPFKTFKNWTLQSIDSSSLDAYGYSTYYNGKLEINEGLKLNTLFYPTQSIYFVSGSEPINASGKYARNIYSVTDAMFYRNVNDPLNLFGVEKYMEDPVTGKKEVREIHNRIITANLKHNVWGEKVIPETINIIDDSNIHQTFDIRDDGYTNLYLTGSHFPGNQRIGGYRNLVSRPYWVSSSGEFYVTFSNGEIQYVNLANAKQYMAMGIPVTYVEPETGSWAWDDSTSRDYFESANEHFGESVSSWGPYVAVGSSMDALSLATRRTGYVSVFKHDSKKDAHRLVAKINFPFTQSVAGTSSYFEDSFGYSVSLRDNFLAVGSPTGSACSVNLYNGYVCVYDKNKGGPDNWGIINMLKGESNGDKFGNSVAIDNDILAVGAPAYSGSKGAVYIFRKHRYMDSGSCLDIPTGSSWQQVVFSSDFCAELVTSSLVVTQSYTPTFVSGNYTWTYETVLTSSIQAVGDNFGWSVSVDANRLIVGTNKYGTGYATMFTCSYYSASMNSCPTASWKQIQIFRKDNTTGDLNINGPEYSVDVSSEIITDKFGYSVSTSGKNVVVGCQYDKAYKPYYAYTGSALVLGAAYFYQYGYVEECIDFQYDLKTKTFGNRKYQTNNKFGWSVSIEGSTAAVTSLPDKLTNDVDYSAGSYILENFSYESSGSADSVLGRATIYNYDDNSDAWHITGELRRNKEENNPYNIYGYSVSLGSDYMCVGAPIVNIAAPSSYSQIIDENNQVSSSFPSSYSGSAYIYNMRKYETNPLIGNIFYNNGYFVITNTGSNYQNIFMGTGSRGFEMNYQGAHTIYEHEYLVSVRPGEFNYSTNPSSLVQNPLYFDVNQDGVVDYKDVSLVMRYLQMKKFYAEFVFDENGIVLEPDTLEDYSWWANDIIQTEATDVLQQESDYAAYLASASFDPFTKKAFDYIETNLVNTGILDIDGDGIINLNDGFIFSLYYFGKLNPTKLSNYITAASTRIYVKDIETYLNQYCGVDHSKVTPEFLNYQYSSSYDPTGSFLAPYITTIGLYQDNQLVAVGKLGRPIKNLIDWPVNIVVRFDT